MTFPDDATYSGTLPVPNLLTWSNGSQWHNTWPGAGTTGLTGLPTSRRPPLLSRLTGGWWRPRAAAWRGMSCS